MEREKLGKICYWVDPKYSYDNLKSIARSVTSGTILKEYIGSVFHSLDNGSGYEIQFYIGDVPDRGHHEENVGIFIYITEIDVDFKNTFKANRKF